MTRTICIIGGSGFVGRSLARQAVDSGWRVRVACRHPEKARRMLVTGISLHRADICDASGLDAVVEGSDVVVNLVGLLYERGRYTFDAAHVQGTKHVLDACARHGVRRYLHMSALGADAQSDSAYARSKYAAEQAVRASALAWTIMRPSVIFGREDSFFNKLEQMSALPLVFPVIAGNTFLQPVWVEDVARAFLRSAEDESTVGQTYALGGPRAYTFMDLVRLLLRVRGRKRYCVAVPDAVANMMAAVLQFLPVPPLTPDQLAMLRRDNIVEGEEPFPRIFGEASSVERVLPEYILGAKDYSLQHRLDQCREHYRRG